MMGNRDRLKAPPSLFQKLTLFTTIV